MIITVHIDDHVPFCPKPQGLFVLAISMEVKGNSKSLLVFLNNTLHKIIHNTNDH